MNEDELKELTDSIFAQHKNTTIAIPAQMLHAFIMCALTASTVEGISEEAKKVYIELTAQAGLQLTDIIPELQELYDNIPINL